MYFLKSKERLVSEANNSAIFFRMIFSPNFILVDVMVVPFVVNWSCCQRCLLFFGWVGGCDGPFLLAICSVVFSIASPMLQVLQK